MRKLLSALAAAVALLMAAAAPAAGITYGEPDNGEHPYVGFMIFFVPSAPGWFSCSGTLLDADTFLTAAHCTFDVGTDGAETPGEATSGGNDVWVTFDETDTLLGWPARADFPDEASLYAARSAWLNDPTHGFTKGIAIHHPDYDDFASFPVTNDVGVVEATATSLRSARSTSLPAPRARAATRPPSRRSATARSRCNLIRSRSTVGSSRRHASSR
jgi:hypothetical protein